MRELLFSSGLKSKNYCWLSIFLILLVTIGNLGQGFGLSQSLPILARDSVPKGGESQLTVQPDELIRFHVLANSDSEEDQAIKRAVRDAVLEEVSPRLAESHSLEESRQILTGLRPKIEQIGKAVVLASGKTYEVKTDYGYFTFPTKSYGSLVLPAGEYEAVRILIGKAEGSNWWCVLFPPLCFVNIEHSTAVQVDGKPGIPIQKGTQAKPEVKFWFWEKLKNLWQKL
ncbi:stage II sporulation protein R [Desulfitobacterium sp.]|uniref:stage II sporulation protein R n=1 Tax=Desulfitobacterium sp. TaxID=49981 RepID=UPI002BE6049F|nr:stage II sporulation protein R [Desulfitobacterium sp.]HVJ49762.1 stage II sporulation protein R [Desulfitobacterium sp.]